MERYHAKPYTGLMRQVMASRTMLDSKVTEYQAHIQAGRPSAAEEARNAASAALDAYLDLSKEMIEAEIRKGWR